MRRAVIYSRVGDCPQGTMATREQVAVCRHYCDHKGYAIVDEYVDEGFSGRYVDRPAFDRLLAEALGEAHPFDVVVVMDPRRFLDDRGLRRSIEAMLADAGVALATVSWDPVYIPGEADTDLPVHLQRSSHSAPPVPAFAQAS